MHDSHEQGHAHHHHPHPHDDDHAHPHHEHGHGHGHGHDHPHSSHAPAAMPFAEKLVKRLEHWHRHNEDHLGDYQQWVTEAQRQGRTEVAAHLQEVAVLTGQISDRLARALAAARRDGGPA